MNLKKIFFYSLFLFAKCLYSFTQELDSISIESQIALKSPDTKVVSFDEPKIAINENLMTTLDSIVPVSKQNSIVYPPLNRDWKRLGYDSAMYIGTTVIAFGVLWIMPESTTNWDKEQMKEKGILWKWKENVKLGPVWDKDNWVLNWITHPYFGGIYYMTARTNGFRVVESFAYSTIMSTLFWEYGIESFAEIPSKQDLIITPIIGSVIGEGFFYAKKSILKHDKKVLKSKFLGITTLFLMDPFNTILDGFGYKKNVKTQVNIAHLGVNQFSKTPIFVVSFSARF